MYCMTARQRSMNYNSQYAVEEFATYSSLQLRPISWTLTSGVTTICRAWTKSRGPKVKLAPELQVNIFYSIDLLIKTNNRVTCNQP
jgi:hypothetical protein